MAEVIGRAKVVVTSEVDSGSVHNTGDFIAKTLKRGAVATGIGVGAIIGAGLAKGFQRLSSIEDAEAKLRGLGSSAKDVTKTMKNALAAVKGTAFGLGDAATVAAQLIAAGAKPGKELETQLKTVTNTAAAAGISLEEMGSIYAKAMTQANGVQNDVLGQLQDRGIPIYQKLAEQLGVSSGAVFKLASDGKISFEQFSKAAKAASGTVADEMGKTVSGSLANAGAALGRLGAAFLGPAFKDAPSIFNAIGRALDDQIPHAEAFAAKISEIVNSDDAQKLINLAKLLTGTEVKPVGTGTVLAPGTEPPKSPFSPESIEQGARDSATGAWGVFLANWKEQVEKNGDQLGDIIAAAFRGTIKDKIFDTLTHEDIGSVLVDAFRHTWHGFDEWFVEVTADFRTSFWHWWHGVEKDLESIPGKIGAKASDWLAAGKKLIGAFVSGLVQGVIPGGAAGQIAQAMKDAINKALPDSLTFFGGKGGLPAITVDLPQLATGTRNFGGGLALVGERGPELVGLPRGSDVYTNTESQQIVSGGGGFTYAPVFNGPSTGAGRLQDMEWVMRFAPRQGVA